MNETGSELEISSISFFHFPHFLFTFLYYYIINTLTHFDQHLTSKQRKKASMMISSQPTKKQRILSPREDDRGGNHWFGQPTFLSFPDRNGTPSKVEAPQVQSSPGHQAYYYFSQSYHGSNGFSSPPPNRSSRAPSFGSPSGTKKRGVHEISEGETVRNDPTNTFNFSPSTPSSHNQTQVSQSRVQEFLKLFANFVLTYTGWKGEWDFALHNISSCSRDEFNFFVYRLKEKQNVFEKNRSHPRLTELDSIAANMNYPVLQDDIRAAEEFHFNTLYQYPDMLFQRILQNMKGKQAEFESKSRPPIGERRNAVEPCTVCLDDAELRCVACIPCGHCCVCEGCARLLMQQWQPSCPICRTKATAFQRIYI